MKLSVRRHFPLIVYIAYVLFTISTLYWGPLKYVDIKTAEVLSYVSIITVLFSLGYCVAVARNLSSYTESKKRFNTLLIRSSTNKILRNLLALGFVCTIFVWVSFFSSGGELDLTALGKNYISSYEGYERGQAKIGLFYILNIVSQTIVTLCFFFSAYYFSGLSKYQKLMLMFICLSYLLTQVVASGKQKSLGDFVVCVAVFFMFQRSRSHTFLTGKILTLSIASIFFIIFLFMEILRQRYFAAGIGVNNISEVTHSLIYWDLDSQVFSILGDGYGFSLGIFLGYLTNGLYGLSLSLQLPFEWTYFIGNSYSLTRVIELFIGEKDSIYQLTYPVRAASEFGWDDTKWHSLYAWLASDFTFIGVSVIALIFGYFYGRLWIDAINARDIASGPLFAMFTLGLFFSLANNQLMHSMSGVLALSFTLALWLVSRLVLRHKTYCNK